MLVVEVVGAAVVVSVVVGEGAVGVVVLVVVSIVEVVVVVEIGVVVVVAAAVAFFARRRSKYFCRSICLRLIGFVVGLGEGDGAVVVVSVVSVVVVAVCEAVVAVASSLIPLVTAAMSALLIDVYLVRWVVGMNVGADADSVGVVFGSRGGVTLGLAGVVVVGQALLADVVIPSQFMPVVLGGEVANLSW